eukprot:TRINITY_DN5142_c0_g1_i1.p1 TRINITY_DN5142_c0_g1~~TRINITY_DN5142_c0_g1_i1.p1  ORF type:complete len:230 (+),score=28.41 TRINITY_DN5142_c0_g1_i1:190-879(+)
MAFSLNRNKSDKTPTFEDMRRYCAHNPQQMLPVIYEHDNHEVIEIEDDAPEQMEMEAHTPQAMVLPPISSLFQSLPPLENPYSFTPNRQYPPPPFTPLSNPISSTHSYPPYGQPILPSFGTMFQRPVHRTPMQQNQFPAQFPIQPQFNNTQPQVTHTHAPHPHTSQPQIAQDGPQFACDCEGGMCCTYGGRGLLGCKCLKVGQPCSSLCHPNSKCLVEVLQPNRPPSDK